MVVRVSLSHFYFVTQSDKCECHIRDATFANRLVKLLPNSRTSVGIAYRKAMRQIFYTFAVRTRTNKFRDINPSKGFRAHGCALLYFSAETHEGAEGKQNSPARCYIFYFDGESISPPAIIIICDGKKRGVIRVCASAYSA